MSKDNHSSANGRGSSLTWGVEAAEQLVLAVHSAGLVCPPHFFRPIEGEGPQRLSEWRDLMDDLSDNVSFAFTRRDVLPDLTYPGRARARAKDLAKILGRVVRLKSGMEMLSRHKRRDGDLLERIDQKLPSHYPNAIAFLEQCKRCVNPVGLLD